MGNIKLKNEIIMKVGLYLLAILFFIRGILGVLGFEIWNKYNGWHRIDIYDAIISLIIARIIIYMERKRRMG